MKNQLLSLGKVLNSETQQTITGGKMLKSVHCVTEDPDTQTSTIKEGPCDPMDIHSHEIDY